MSAPGSVAIVTGASSGIGLEVTRALLAGGSAVVANARDAAKLAQVTAELAGRERLALVPGDVGAPDTSERLVVAAHERFGDLHTVVANAGIFDPKPFVDFTAADLDRFVATNLRGPIGLAQAAVRSWRERARSPSSATSRSIVFVTASIAISPQRAIPATLPIAIKGGLNALTRALALELAGEGIRVNAVAPGIIATPLIPDPEALAGAQPIGHVGQTSDVAGAIRYLAGAPFVTGVVLPVDGGMAAGRW